MTNALFGKLTKMIVVTAYSIVSALIESLGSWSVARFQKVKWFVTTSATIELVST